MQQRYRVFLASSAELINNRKEFELAITRLNKGYEDAGRHFEFRLDVWEDFNTAIAPKTKQDEYNESIRECHIFVMLYWTKVGMYTNGEFDLAYRRFTDSKFRGPKMFVYHCTEPVPATQTAADRQSIKDFEHKLLHTVGHFKDVYKDAIELVKKFKEQLDILFSTHYLHYGTPAQNLSLNSFQAAPSYFIGRDKDMAEVRERLKTGKKLMLINAEGGIGKTSLAARYWDESLYEYKYNAWLFCDTGIVPEILKMAPALGMDTTNMDDAQVLAGVKIALHDKEDDFLLVLDNANKKEHILDFMRHFSGYRWHVLITSRCHDVIDKSLEMKIDTLPPDMAKALFKNFYKEDSAKFDALLDKLLKAIEYNTLLTELFAKNMQKLRRHGETLEVFIKRLETGHLFLGERAFEVQSDYATIRHGRQATPDEILTALYDVNQLSETEQFYMVTLALLPATSYDLPFLATLFEPTDSITTDKTLEKLSGLGWLVSDGDTYRISPVIQHILLVKYEGKLQPIAEPLITNLNNRLKMNEYGQLEKGTYEDVQPYITVTDNIFASLEGAAWDDISYLCYLLNTYYRVTGNTSQTKKYAEKLVEISTQLGAANPSEAYYKNSLAIAHERLGDIYERIGDRENAIKSYHEYNRLEQELYDASPETLEYKNGLAISHNKLGNIYEQMGDWDNALKNYQDDIKITRKLYEASPGTLEYKNGLAISHQYLGNVYSQIGDWESALENYWEYNRLKRELYDASPATLAYKNGLAISHNKLGNIYGQMGDWDNALKNYQEDINITRELYEASPATLEYKNHIAISNQNLGIVYADTGDWENALKNYIEYNRLEQELYAASPRTLEYKNNLALSHQYLGNVYEQTGDWENALKNYREDIKITTELYAASPGTLEYKNGLAISYLKLGQLYEQLQNLIEAKNYYFRGQKLLQELNDNSPGIVLIIHNLDWVKEKLAEM